MATYTYPESNGATRYLNSILQAQMWAMAITEAFTMEAWDAS